MSSHNEIDERFDSLVQELRSGKTAASGELRERVQAIAAKTPETSRRKPWLEHFSWRRAVLVAAPACVLAGVGAAMLHGFTTSDSRQVSKGLELQRSSPHVTAGGPAGQPAWKSFSSPQKAAADIPPPSSRLQDYRVTMRVRVAGNDQLSRATVRAMRVTRSLGGYVASVRYSTPSVRDGDAVLILRVPIGKVQRAVLAYAGLGTIVSQNFSVIDLQKRYDAQVERAAKLRAQIAKLEARLETEALTDGDRALVKEQLEYARSELTVLTRETRTTLNQARLATARLSLTTFHPQKKQELAPVPSRFDRMLDDTVGVLASEAVWAGYALFLGGPFVLLGLIALAAGRSHRRRADRRLLAA